NPFVFNDNLEWNIQPSEGQALQGSIDVNTRHGEWGEAETDGRECQGFSPAHVETGMTLTAPDDAALTVEIELSATNIGDGNLPSTVLVGVLPVVSVEFFPQLLNGDGNAIAGSENPRTAPDQTNGMTEENPVANRIAHREMKMRIVDGEVLEGKELTWTMEPLYVHPDEQDPAFRGAWTHSTNHNTYFEISAHYGAYDFATIAAQPTPVSATTTIDESAESALRINLPPIGFNQGRVKIEVEDFQGDPAKVADMEVPAVVVIDPGHGGTDSGNQSEGFDEKDLTLDYAQSTRDQLVIRFLERQPFHRVIITRNNDATLANIDRPQRARDEGADVFLSIHFNGGGTTARGAETLIRGAANVNQGEDQALAERIQDAAVTAVGFTRTPGVKDYSPSDPSQPSTWMVLRDDQQAFRNTTDYHPIRGCIQEVDFMSNPTALNAITDATNGPILRANYASGVSVALITDIENQP
ncbi:MAG: N-acetylmuramoyl-L-alanine amidase, partial [Verrucomicrobiaceae bacterium]